MGFSNKTPEAAPENTIGLTHVAHAYDGHPGLRDQLREQGVAFSETEIPHLVGMAGCASLVFYLSPVDGAPITTLAVPIRADVDSFGESYYIFRGLTREEALRDEQAWLDRYEACRQLDEQSFQSTLREASHRQATEITRCYVYEREPIRTAGDLRTYRACKVYVGTFNSARAAYAREFGHAAHGFVEEIEGKPPRSSIFELEVPADLAEEVLP
jgi:hypothetical protein